MEELNIFRLNSKVLHDILGRNGASDNSSLPLPGNDSRMHKPTDSTFKHLPYRKQRVQKFCYSCVNLFPRKRAYGAVA
jgi:hypothetical protein